MEMDEYGYAWVKAEAKRRGMKVTDLIVMSQKNDPFFTGSASSRRDAEWFADLWVEFGHRTAHLRRIHYQLVSQDPPRRKPDGKPYLNAYNDWTMLKNASKYARDLDLVSDEAIIDQRNPPPGIYHDAYPPAEVDIQVGFSPWELPSIEPVLSLPQWQWPVLSPAGYGYLESDQPLLLEIWVEKSTMNDVLNPICRRYGVNLVTGIGHLSDAACTSLLRRIQYVSKPCRILYVSDFDPSGDTMPRAVARRIEYKMRRSGFDLDVKLEPIALIREQVQQFRLPKVPTKETDSRRAGFEARHGEGCVELDALEALYPGELGRIVWEWVGQFRDRDLGQKMADAQQEAIGRLAQARQDTITRYEARVIELRERVEAVVERYRDELRDLSERLEADMAELRRDVESCCLGTKSDLDSLEADLLPELPKPELPPDSTDWLFDSNRDYFVQLKVYKARYGDDGS